MATMYDAVDVEAIPSGAAIIGAYVDGDYVTYGEVRARFPRAFVVGITVKGRHGVKVCDCESGDLTPEQAAQWAAVELNSLRRPTIYCSADTMAEVVNEMRSQSVVPSMVDWWIADWTGVPHVWPGSAATQYASPLADPKQCPGNFDLSATNGSWPFPPPPPEKEETMQLYATDTKGTGFIIAADLSSKRGLPDAPDAVSLQSTGLYKIVELSDELLAAIPGN